MLLVSKIGWTFKLAPNFRPTQSIHSLKNKLIILFLENYYISLKRIISRVNNYNCYVGFSFRIGKRLISLKVYHNGALDN